jgi:ABC-type branched-subunit amino acid transport system substrate-binding protein
MTPEAACPTAAATLSLTGRYHRQGTEAAQALRLWANRDGVRLTLVDDAGSAAAAAHAYAEWTGAVDLLIGPYASGLVRRVAPLVRDGERLLWNHGGSADDLAQPMIVCVAAPASTYLCEAVDIAAGQHHDRMVIVQGPGPFARAVADGAADHARQRGIRARRVESGSIDSLDTVGAGWLLAGHFEHDTDLVRRLRRRTPAPSFIAAVAAGIRAFGRELGTEAEGIHGPAQWWPDDTVPDVGPAGTEFLEAYRARTGHEPSYIAAQAAAAGFLATAARRLELTADDVIQWETSTLLGRFQLDPRWRQVGHHITTVYWKDGQLVRANTAPS